MLDDDAPAMHAIHTKAVVETCAPLLTSAVVEAWLRDRSPDGYIRGRDEGGETFLIAEVRGIRAGFASWRGSWLEALFIDPDFQGHGVGRALFVACEQDAEKNGNFLSDLNATLNAKGFYQNLGFKAVEAGFEEKFGERIPHVAMVRVSRGLTR